MFEVLVSVAAVAYIRPMFKGQTKPNRVTWLMWTIASFTAACAAFSNGATWATMPVFMSGFSPFLILLASSINKRAYWKVSAFDYACGARARWNTTKQRTFLMLSKFSDAEASTQYYSTLNW